MIFMKVKELYKQVMNSKIEDSNGNKVDYVGPNEKKQIFSKKVLVIYSEILAYASLAITVISFIIICYLAATSGDDFVLPDVLGFLFCVPLLLTPFLFLIFACAKYSYKNLLLNYYINIDNNLNYTRNNVNPTNQNEKMLLISENKNYYNYYKAYTSVIVAETYSSKTGNKLGNFDTTIILSLFILQFSVIKIIPYSIGLWLFVLFAIADFMFFLLLVKEKNKKLTSFFYKIPDAHNFFNITKFSSDTIDEFTNVNTLVFYGEPYPEFLNFLYNMFYNCNALKQQNINVYTLTTKDLAEKYHFDYKKMFENKTPYNANIFCIKTSDLVINDENMSSFSSLKDKLNLQYFSDFAKYYM